MKRAWLAVLVAFAAAWVQAAEPAVVFLWSGVAPGSEGKAGEEKTRITEGGERVVSQVHRPSLTAFLPRESSAPAAGVLVIPGGGHRELWMDHEGYNVARWLAERGVAAFVLKYRLAREEGSTYRVERESLADAQQALRVVRERAAEWRVDPARVGVIGFSAGGELAALAAAGQNDRETAVAFQALIYPGRASAITPAAGAPPAFLLCGANDRAGISEELPLVYRRFKHAGVAAELHIFAHAGHGFGLRSTNRSASAGWIERFHEWLRDGGFLEGR